MRVHTIQIANLCVVSNVVTDPDGGLVWVVRVTERGPERRLVFERRGDCGDMPTGDALDIAAYHASEIAAGLASLAGGERPEACRGVADGDVGGASARV
jgi:hypothetical protein